MQFCKASMMIMPLRRRQELKAGDHFVIENPVTQTDLPFHIDDVPLYGQILDGRNCEPGFFNVIAYSVLCPNGEEGRLCAADITRILSRDEFETARREGWTV